MPCCEGYNFTPPHHQSNMMSVKCLHPFKDLTVLIWLLYNHLYMQELLEEHVVCRRQPNLNSNCQLVCMKSKVKVCVYGRRRQCKGYDNIMLTQNTCVRKTLCSWWKQIPINLFLHKGQSQGHGVIGLGAI